MLRTEADGSRPPHSCLYNLIEAATQLLLAPFLRSVPPGGRRKPRCSQGIWPSAPGIRTPFCLPELPPPPALIPQQIAAWTRHWVGPWWAVFPMPFPSDRKVTGARALKRLFPQVAVGTQRGPCL